MEKKKRATNAQTKKQTKEVSDEEEKESVLSESEEEETDTFKEPVVIVVHLPNEEVEYQIGHQVKYKVKSTPN